MDGWKQHPRKHCDVDWATITSFWSPIRSIVSAGGAVASVGVMLIVSGLGYNCYGANRKAEGKGMQRRQYILKYESVRTTVSFSTFSNSRGGNKAALRAIMSIMTTN